MNYYLLPLELDRSEDGMVMLVYFPQEFLALQKELIKFHPDILAKLEFCTDNAEAFGVIGAELGIVLDGMYEPVDLARMLLKKLEERRTTVLRVGPDVERLVPATVRESEDALTIELAQPPDRNQKKKE